MAADLVITFRVRVAGVLTSATSVMLSDPGATMGVVRDDTAESIIAAGTLIPQTSTGVYQIVVPGAIAGVVYRYYVKTVLNGSTYWDEDTAELATADHYAQQTDIELWQGAANVAIYSNVTGGRTVDVGRIEGALTRADTLINRALRQRGYSAPLSSSSADYAQIKEIAARLALYWLYSPRESRDGSDVTDDTGAIIKANTWRRRALDELNGLLLNGIDGDRNTDAPEAPTAVG